MQLPDPHATSPGLFPVHFHSRVAATPTAHTLSYSPKPPHQVFLHNRSAGPRRTQSN